MSNYPCIECNSEVRGRQEALQCEVCDRWQHRTCNTGMYMLCQELRYNDKLTKEEQWFEPRH